MNTATPDRCRYLSVTEAHALLRNLISLSTLYRMAQDGRIDCVRIGARVFVRAEWIDEITGSAAPGEAR